MLFWRVYRSKENKQFSIIELSSAGDTDTERNIPNTSNTEGALKERKIPKDYEIEPKTKIFSNEEKVTVSVFPDKQGFFDNRIGENLILDKKSNVKEIKEGDLSGDIYKSEEYIYKGELKSSVDNSDIYFGPHVTKTIQTGVELSETESFTKGYTENSRISAQIEEIENVHFEGERGSSCHVEQIIQEIAHEDDVKIDIQGTIDLLYINIYRYRGTERGKYIRRELEG